MESPDLENIVEKMMQQEDHSFENHMINFVNILFKDYEIAGFEEMFENNVAWYKLSEVANFKSLAFDDKFYEKKNVQNFVEMIKEIWDAERQIDLFKIFNKKLKEEFNESFDFVKDFGDHLYTHSNLIMQIIMISTFLTCFEIRLNDDSIDRQVFSCVKQFAEDQKESQIYMVQFMKDIEQIFQIFQKQSVENESKTKQEFNSLPNANLNRKRVTTLADMEILKKVEKQQNIIDDMEKENQDLRKLTQEQKEKLEEQTSDITNFKEEINRMVFAKEDLIERLKDKNLDFVSNEIEEKDEQISELLEKNKSLEKELERRQQEEENHNEQMNQMNLQLENYKQLFQQNQSNNQKIDSENKESYVDIKQQFEQNQDELYQEKEKCIKLDLKVGQLNIEIQNLKMEKQDLEFKLKNSEDINYLGTSEVYENDLEEIKKNLDVNKEIEKFDNLDSKFKTIFKQYEQKCISTIKTLLIENQERKSKLEDYIKHTNELKQENDDLLEKVNDLENKMVGDFINKNQVLQQIFDDVNENQSEIAQDLLKTIMKNEHEIRRQVMNRRKMREIHLQDKSDLLEQLQTVYTMIGKYYEQ